MQGITLISLPLTLPFSSSISPSFPLLFHLSLRLFIQHSLAASLMSVLSCGPPFHTAAFTIMSITSNYLAVFPLLALSPAFISALELYAFQMGATAFPHLPQRRGGGRRGGGGGEEVWRRRAGEQAEPGWVKTNLVCRRLEIVKPGWPDLHHHTAAHTHISGVITLFHSFRYLASTLHLSPFILRHSFA